MSGKSGLDMLLTQYNNSFNFRNYIQCFLDEFSDIRKAQSDTIKYRNLSNSFGMIVDDLAYLVGASRIIYGAASLGFFGFYENPSALPAGDDNIPDVGGVLRSDSDRESGDFVRTDAQLKSSIRARIVKMGSNVCTNDILAFCDLVLGKELPLELVEGDLKVDFIYHGRLSVSDKVLLAYMLPDLKPVGVGYSLKDDDGYISLVYGSSLYPPDVL